MSKLHILRTVESGGKQEAQLSFLVAACFPWRCVEGAYLSTFDCGKHRNYMLQPDESRPNGKQP